MSIIYFIFGVLSYIIYFLSIHPVTTLNVLPPDEICIQCICEMATGCNLTLGCVNEGTCGPFRMTEPYWIDAGKPVLHLDDSERSGAFARCANDPVCASQAVKGYAERYGEDCDEDNEINCMDYARIHQYGYGTFCKRPLILAQLIKLKKCLDENQL